MRRREDIAGEGTREWDRVLVDLARSRRLAAGEVEAALAEITEAAARTLGVERASVWRYEEERTVLCCLDLYERGGGSHSRSPEIAAADYPAYFAALEQERTIAAHDALADPRTAGLAAGYLVPLGIASMLDAPVRVHGRMAGVACHEHVGPPRRWSAAEQGFAAAIADLVALALEAGERRRAEDELREQAKILRASEERYRTLADAMPQLVWTSDGDGRLNHFNRRWREFLGTDPQEYLDLGWLAVVHPDDVARTVETRRRGLAAGEPYELEYRLRRGDGEHRWHLARVVPMKDAEGRVQAWFGTATDIHEVKRVEAELRQAKEAAEAASQAKDRFLATLSHELRTPLTPVLAAVSSLERDEGLPGAVRDRLAMIRRNVELEARLIDDMLDLTRIVRGKLELKREATDVRRLLEQAVEICCTPAVEAGRLRLVLDLAAASHRAWADAPRLTQVFWNLLNNAVKFTPEGGTVTVRSRLEESAGGAALVVEVVDTGIGFEPGMAAHLFDAFQQGRRTITRRFGGLGLGLAISKTIVELHGGTLAAASDGEGSGATFTVRLPAGAGATAAPGPSSLAGEPPRSPAARPLHLLLVEDHPDTAEAMADLLGLRGYRVTVAASVAAAREAAERARDGEAFDLVVSDVGLPDGSGLDLMRELAARYRLKGVALSGYGMEEDVQRSAEAGFGRHLTKPVDLGSLEAAIRDVMGG